MTCTAKNITKNDDVEIKELQHTADLHVQVALLKVSNLSKLLVSFLWNKDKVCIRCKIT